MQGIYKVGSMPTLFVYLVDATDGFTPKTGLSTLSSAVVYKANSVVVNQGGSFNELSLGWYTYTPLASETNVVGPCGFDFFKSGITRHFPVVIQLVNNDLDTIYGTLSAAYNLCNGTAAAVPTGGHPEYGVAVIQAGADKVWDTVLASHLVAGSTGKQLNTASAAADPWAVTLPGSYTGQQAGNKLAAISGGAGLGTFVVQITDATNAPLSGVYVAVTTSNTDAKSNVLAAGFTNAQGLITLFAPPGVYYLYRFLSGKTFINPTQVTFA